MPRTSVFDLALSKVYPAIVGKAERKGRTREEVDTLTSWLLGYSPEAIAQSVDSDMTYGDFFRKAPAPNPKAEQIHGTVCHVAIDKIEDPVIKQMRRLDKLVDDLAKGKAMEKILPQ